MSDGFDDIFIRNGAIKLHASISYAHVDLLDAVGRMESFFDDPDCEIIKDQKKVKVARAAIEIDGKNVQCYIKQFKPFSLRKRLEGIFYPSRARRAWKGAKELLSNGINTAEPIAAVEVRKCGLLRESYYITKEIPNSEISVHHFSRRFASEDPESTRQKREFVRALAGFFRAFHRTSIYHSDLKDYNIMVSADGDCATPIFWALDVECVGRYWGMGGRRKLKNLVQITKTLGREMTAADRMAFLREYFGLDASQPLDARRKRLVKKVLRRSGTG